MTNQVILVRLRMKCSLTKKKVHHADNLESLIKKVSVALYFFNADDPDFNEQFPGPSFPPVFRYH